MTHQEKIEAIRAACVKANPDFHYRWCCGDEDKVHFCPNCSSNMILDTVRLADVLEALGKTSNVVCIASNERFELFDSKKNEWVQQFKTWYFHRDDLTLQDEATIDFIYDLLK